MRTEVVTDVIAGTSAGGINGAMLGFVVANGRTLETAGAGNPIKEIWQRLGAIETLLASKAPDSALDDLFLFQGCADAFHTLGSTTALPDAAPTRMRLTVTATDSGGYAVEQEGVTARDHRLELRFRNMPRPEGSAILLSPSLREAIARAVPGQQVGAGTAWPFLSPRRRVTCAVITRPTCSPGRHGRPRRFRSRLHPVSCRWTTRPARSTATRPA